MKKYAMVLLVTTLIVGLNTVPVWAYHCPNLVKTCYALVAKLEKRADIDKQTLANAKQSCEQALRLHESGWHKESVIKVGEAISLAGASIKK